MYEAYSSKTEILIGCFLPGKLECNAKKRKNPSDDNLNEKRTKRVAEIEDKMNEVKHILAKLQSKHGKKFSVEQYRGLYILKSKNRMMNHQTFLVGKQDNKSNAHPHAIDGAHATTTTTTNPSTVPEKCTNLRTECIQQLQLVRKG